LGSVERVAPSGAYQEESAMQHEEPAMNLYIIRRRDFWATAEELGKTAARSAEVGDEMSQDVRWIRTYVVQEESGQLGTVCLYEGTSPEKVREQAERTGMPADEVALVADTVIIRPDPVPANA
jgi:hypothetical protein